MPTSRLNASDRLDTAEVPESFRRSLTKPEIALEEIERLMRLGIRYRTVLADASYGLSAPFRQGLSACKLFWAVGISKVQKVYPVNVALIFPVAGKGHPRKTPFPTSCRWAPGTYWPAPSGCKSATPARGGEDLAGQTLDVGGGVPSPDDQVGWL